MLRKHRNIGPRHKERDANVYMKEQDEEDQEIIAHVDVHGGDKTCAAPSLTFYSALLPNSRLEHNPQVPRVSLFMYRFYSSHIRVQIAT
jgi:hypothetical protein